MKTLERLGTQPVGQLLKELSIPAAVGTVVNALYNVVDRFFIGQGYGPDALAGVTLAFPFMMILVAFGTLIGVGSAAMMSIKLGERDRVAAEKVLGQCVAVKIIFFVTLPVLGIVFMDDLLPLFGATPQAIPYAKEYLRITLYGNLFSHLAFGLSALMRAEGNARQSMRCMVAGAVANMVLDPIFIFGFGWGVAGAAWATNVSTALACAYAFSHYLRRNSAVRFRLRRVWVYPRLIAPVFAIGLSPFAIQFAAGAVNVAFNRAFNLHAAGEAAATVEIAAMGAVGSLMFLFIMPLMGLTQGMQPIVGYNHGANNPGRVRETYVLTMKVSTFFCATVTAVSLAAAGPLARCFTSDPALLAATARGLRLYACAFAVVGTAFVSVGYFQSVGRPFISIALSLMRQLLVLIPLIVLLPRFWGVTGVWLAQPFADVISTAATAFVVAAELRRLKRQAG